MTATVDLFTAGAAALGLWIVYRFPSAGPRSLIRTLVLVGAAFLVLALTASAVGAVVDQLGPAGTLLLVVLPALVFVFWAWACLVRALVDAIPPLQR